MRVLVVGGAGYIGSHMVKMLLQKGYQVITFDNLSTGFRDAVLGGEFVEGDLADPIALEQLFHAKKPDAVMHFASSSQVGESVADPEKYYRNNLANTLNLLRTMIHHGVMRIIFSSSAAIFGEPSHVPIDEAHTIGSINPYGKSKYMVEQILADYEKAYGLKYVSLRYFNAAGADVDVALGERHDPETHLIPLTLQVASGRRTCITVFGRDYATPDGTCIRDYVHIVDICSAHLLALTYLLAGKHSACFNLGNGEGYSVQQVINVAKQVTGKKIMTIDGLRREGDPARLVADSDKAISELGWTPRYSSLHKIIADAWNWECRQIESRESSEFRGTSLHKSA